jgi:hypothetical protein
MNRRTPQEVPSFGDTDLATQYFVTDASQATLLEIWRVSGVGNGRIRRIILVFLIAVAKLFGRTLRVGTPVSLADTKFIELDQIPDEVIQQQRPLVQPILAAGFEPLFSMKNDSTNALTAYCMYLRSRDHMTVAGVLFARAKSATRMLLQLSSKRRNGSIIATNNSSRMLRIPPEIRAVYLENVSPSTVLDRHQRRIHEFTDLILFTDDAARDLIREMSRRICDYRAQCGLYVPATQEELRRSGLKG